MSISWHSFRVEESIMAREHICSLCNVRRTAVTFSVQYICLTGPRKIYFGHKILMQPSHDCSYEPMGGRPNGDLLEKTDGKLKSSLGAPRITEQPWRRGSSARYIRDPIMIQGYWPGEGL